MIQYLRALRLKAKDTYSSPIVFLRNDMLMLAELHEDSGVIEKAQAVTDALPGPTSKYVRSFYERARKVAAVKYLADLPACSYMSIQAEGICLVYGNTAVPLTDEEVMMGKPWVVQGDHVYDCCNQLICQFSGKDAVSYIREAMLLNHLT